MFLNNYCNSVDLSKIVKMVTTTLARTQLSMQISTNIGSAREESLPASNNNKYSREKYESNIRGRVQTLPITLKQITAVEH